MTGIKYTASTTFTVPTGVSIIYISMVGGGQGGSGGNNFGAGYGGQSGSAAIDVPFICSAGQVISVFVGAGGAGSNVISASGGGAGTGSYIAIGTSKISTIGGGSTNATQSTAQSNFGSRGNGGQGSSSAQKSGYAIYGRSPTNQGPGSTPGGGGGNSWLGDGANGGGDNANGSSALANTGAGGGGSGVNFSTTGTGGNGGTGCVIISY